MQNRGIKEPFNISGKIWSYTCNKETTARFRIDEYWPKARILSQLEKFLRGTSQQGEP